MITAADLREEIANLEAQQRQALEVFQQATGALSLARAMLARFEDNVLESPAEMTVNEFAEMVAGPGATATIHENGEHA